MRPEHGVGDFDDLAVGALGVAEHSHVQSGRPEAGHGAAAVVRRVAAGEPVGQDPGLLPCRRDEPGGPATVLGAVADRVDRRVVDRGQPVVDDDASSHGEAGSAGQGGGGTAAGGEHHQVGVQREPVVEDQPVVGEPDRPGTGVDPRAEAAEVAGEDPAGLLVDLAAEQVVAALDDLGVEAADAQRPGHLEAEEPTADHDRSPGSGHRGVEAEAVVEAAERVHLLVQPAVDPDQPADRRQGRDRARGQDQDVVGHPVAVGELDLAVSAVDLRDARPEAQVDVVRHAHRDAVDGMGALQHRGQQDPVVRRVSLVAEQRHIRPAGQGLGQSYRGHPGAHHDHPHARTCAAGEVTRGLSACRTSR